MGNTMLRIPVDFNTMMTDEYERVYINTLIHKDVSTHLYPGLRVIMYEENDIEVEGVLVFNQERNEWLGQPDWSTRRVLYNPD